MKANDPYNRRLLINDTIARLRELEGKASELPWEVTAFVTDSDDHNDNDAILIAETRNALHALLDHIEGLEATIGKHERREDEHCRQIEGKDKKLKLMNDVSRLAQTKIADLERKNALLLAVAKVAKQLKFRVETVVEKQIADEFIKTLKAAKDGKAM